MSSFTSPEHSENDRQMANYSELVRVNYKEPRSHVKEEVLVLVNGLQPRGPVRELRFEVLPPNLERCLGTSDIQIRRQPKIIEALPAPVSYLCLEGVEDPGPSQAPLLAIEAPPLSPVSSVSSEEDESSYSSSEKEDDVPTRPSTSSLKKDRKVKFAGKSKMANPANDEIVNPRIGKKRGRKPKQPVGPETLAQVDINTIKPTNRYPTRERPVKNIDKNRMAVANRKKVLKKKRSKSHKAKIDKKQITCKKTKDGQYDIKDMLAKGMIKVIKTPQYPPPREEPNYSVMGPSFNQSFSPTPQLQIPLNRDDSSAVTDFLQQCFTLPLAVIPSLNRLSSRY